MNTIPRIIDSIYGNNDGGFPDLRRKRNADDFDHSDFRVSEDGYTDSKLYQTGYMNRKLLQYDDYGDYDYTDTGKYAFRDPHVLVFEKVMSTANLAVIKIGNIQKCKERS